MVQYRTLNPNQNLWKF